MPKLCFIIGKRNTDMFDDLIKNLEPAFQQSLPGKPVQYQMAHQVRQLKISMIQPPDDAREAGVLALLYPKQDDVFITLIRRANRGTHSGQVAFPGGGVEEQDNSMIETALREAEEEVGINPTKVEILGELTELYIPVSNRLVNAFVGYTTEVPNYVIQESEVQYVIEGPVSHLMNDQRVKYNDLNIQAGLTLKDVPYFDIDGHMVWGATAMILNEFKHLIRQTKEVV
ncbi:MAG: CoA pyrophosphatase [Bacteroidota bacterium]